MVPDNRILYKSGDLTVAAQKVKSLIPSFSDPLTSRSPYSSHVRIGDRLQGSGDERIQMHWTPEITAQKSEPKIKLR